MAVVEEQSASQVYCSTLATGQAVIWTSASATLLGVPWLSVGLSLLKLLGWIFTALFLAGLTGLLRKT